MKRTDKRQYIIFFDFFVFAGAFPGLDARLVADLLEDGLAVIRGANASGLASGTVAHFFRQFHPLGDLLRNTFGEMFLSRNFRLRNCAPEQRQALVSLVRRKYIRLTAAD
jgi:hypothetical protein